MSRPNWKYLAPRAALAGLISLFVFLAVAPRPGELNVGAGKAQATVAVLEAEVEAWQRLAVDGWRHASDEVFPPAIVLLAIHRQLHEDGCAE